MTNKPVTQRLFGKTVIDSLDINQNGWYIDEVQVTASAEDINNAAGSVPVYNATGGAFTVGMLLHISSYDATAGCYKVEKADANTTGKPAQLIAVDTIADTKTTTAETYYSGAALNTATSAVGAPVYLSETAGGYTLSMPTASDSIVQIVGRVLTVDASGTVLLDLNYNEKNVIGSSELAGKCVTAAKLGSDVAGEGLSGGNGTAIALDLNELTLATPDPTADSIPIIDASVINTSKKATLASLNLVRDAGVMAAGWILFTGVGDCASITIGTATYTRGVADHPNGVWASGADPAGAATELVSAINEDIRNGGTSYWLADANGALVTVWPLMADVGTSKNGTTITINTPVAEPSSNSGTLSGGVNPTLRKTCRLVHTITTAEASAPSVEVTIPIASPAYWDVKLTDNFGNGQDLLGSEIYSMTLAGPTTNNFVIGVLNTGGILLPATWLLHIFAME